MDYFARIVCYNGQMQMKGGATQHSSKSQQGVETVNKSNYIS